MLFALEYMLAEFGALPARYREVQEQVGTQVAPERPEQGLVLDAAAPAGRRLDFVMQELNREAHTLPSKSQHVEATRATVDVKVLIEQVRDRVQNVA